jgi:hypothetical protein
MACLLQEHEYGPNFAIRKFICKKPSAEVAMDCAEVVKEESEKFRFFQENRYAA